MSQRNWDDLTGPLTTTTTLRPISGGKREGLVYARVYEWRSYPDEAPMVQYREVANDPESEIVEEPARWWTPRSIGFRAKILVNPLGGEVRRALKAHLNTLTGNGDETDHLKALADRVIAWDYVIVNDAGERDEVAPPASDPEQGWQQFYELPNDVLIWLKDEIESAHLPKAPTRPNKRGITDTPLEAPVAASPVPERHPASSQPPELD
jgi:hypothetical protein